MTDIKITDVRALGGDSAFLVDDGKTAVLYDTGFGFTGEKIYENIKKELGDRALDYIFLTHSHYDHALGAPYIARHYKDVKIVAGSYAAGIFQRDGAKRVMRELDRKFADTCGVGEYECLVDELRVDIPANDGDVIEAGDMKFEVVNLPGHTKCSVGYYLRNEGILLSTETLGVFESRDLIVPSFLVGYQMTLDSIARAKELSPRVILSPHKGLLTEEETRDYLECAADAAKDVAHCILERLEKGEETEEIIEWFKNRFWHERVRESYPIDAMRLNSSIMIELIRRELLQKQKQKTSHTL